MLQKLSYLNLVTAIIYVLVYLKSGTFNSTSGILMVIVFSWLGIRAYEKDEYTWRTPHYLIAAWVLYFIGRTLYGAMHILGTTMEYDFIANDTVVFLVCTFGFCTSVLVHVLLYFLRHYRAIKDLQQRH